MEKATTSAESVESQYRDPDHLLNVYRDLILPRRIEEKMLKLIRQGKLAKWFSGYGQEAIAVGCVRALRETDYVLPMHRNLGAWTTRGLPLERLFAQLFGKEGGYTKGRDRTYHFGSPEHHIVGMISHLGAMMPVACGLGLAAQLKGSDGVALSFVGEGATREGDFHEALSLAGVWKLPVIFVIENNGYGLSTPSSEAIAVENLADAAAGYGMPGVVVDGNSVMAVETAVEEAARGARAGHGPSLLEMKTFRMRGHEEASGTKYVPEALFDEWASRDPVARLRSRALEEGVTEETLDLVLGDVDAEIEAAVSSAMSRPGVTSSLEFENADVFAVSESPQSEASTSREIRFIDAIQEGLDQSLALNDRTMVMGQDIAEYGGVFKVTEGFLERYGADRIRNTPIIESGVLGAAMGLALEGFSPIVEMQYADFISCGFNQIVNNLATTHYRWGSPVNVTIRAPFGGSIGAGPFHSQSPEAWFCHTPGLKVVVPSTPENAKGLLMSAIHDPNPVLVFEHKFLYRSLRGLVPTEAHYTELGKARVARSGSQLSIVTYGIGVLWALQEALLWEEKGVDIEVIDLQTLVPLDEETVMASVKKTGRLIALHEATATGGFASEVIARAVASCFEYLDAPPVRLGSADLPVPFSKSLEDDVFSARSLLGKAVERTLKY